VDGAGARKEKIGTTRAAPSKVTDIFLARLGDLEKRVEKELGRTSAGAGPAGEFVVDLVRECWNLGSRIAGAAATSAGRSRLLASFGAASPVDELGVDPSQAETLRELIRPLARRWLGLREVRSAALPATGGVLVLLNRSAWPLPVEALVLWAFLCDGRMGGRRMAVLWDEDSSGLPELPWLGDLARRVGLVAATEGNAFALLERGSVVLAFPEGSAARAKTYERRYRLSRFACTGILEAAVEAGARIVPGAVVGSEESFPVLGHVGPLPVTAQFPLLGLLGLLPLPLTWSVRLGAAMEFASGTGEGPGVDAIADAVRARMSALLGELLSERDSIVQG
jgi:hypothetical protein